ncbi:hypothetical protein PFISCL1PPCAC_8370, partial [Pristionchus fissidentatus]
LSLFLPFLIFSMTNYTTLFVVLSGLSIVALLSALTGLAALWNEATEFYDSQMADVYQFKQYSNDAWEILLTDAAPTGNKKSTTAGKSPFINRKKRSTEDVCSCVESAQLCPPGTPGEPGAPGLSGAPGEKGATGAHGADYLPPLRKRSYDGLGEKRCFTCPPGLAGRKGPDGKTGSPGRPGMPGRRGSPGRHGLKGEKGEMGAPGNKGTPGVDGVRGHAGQKGIKGHGAPGRPGARGAPGPRGKQGLNGLIGLPGLQGKIGKKGPIGFPGAAGKDGSTGPEGYPGLPGQDSDYCVCPVRKDKTAEQGGSTASPYLLKVDVSEPNNYQRRETPLVETSSHVAVKNLPLRKKKSRKGSGHGRRSTPAFTITEFSGAPNSGLS